MRSTSSRCTHDTTRRVTGQAQQVRVIDSATKWTFNSIFQKIINYPQLFSRTISADDQCVELSAHVALFGPEVCVCVCGK